MERLVKSFGYEEMARVTPEAHQRLLVHLRKQKVYAHNKAVERRAERDARKGIGVDGTFEAEHEVERMARKERHAEYEAMLEEVGEDASNDAGFDKDDMMDDGEGGSGVRMATGDSARRAVRKARRPDSAAASLAATWMDGSESAAGLDLLSAPLLPMASNGDRAAAAGGASGGGGGGGGKRRRAAAEEEEAGFVDFDEAGKLVVSELSAAAAAEARTVGQMEVDPVDEIVRPGSMRGSANKKRQRLAERAVATASRAEEAEAGGGARNGRTNAEEHSKRRLHVKPTADHFGATFGEQYAGKKGASGDVTRTGAAQPYAYLPLNPRLLGKKQARKASETMGMLASASKHSLKAKKGGRVGKHGLQARRGRTSSSAKQRPHPILDMD